MRLQSLIGAVALVIGLPSLQGISSLNDNLYVLETGDGGNLHRRVYRGGKMEKAEPLPINCPGHPDRSLIRPTDLRPYQQSIVLQGQEPTSKQAIISMRDPLGEGTAAVHCLDSRACNGKGKVLSSAASARILGIGRAGVITEVDGVIYSTRDLGDLSTTESTMDPPFAVICPPSKSALCSKTGVNRTVDFSIQPVLNIGGRDLFWTEHQLGHAPTFHSLDIAQGLKKGEPPVIGAVKTLPNGQLAAGARVRKLVYAWSKFAWVDTPDPNANTFSHRIFHISTAPPEERLCVGVGGGNCNTPSLRQVVDIAAINSLPPKPATPQILITLSHPTKGWTGFFLSGKPGGGLNPIACTKSADPCLGSTPLLTGFHKLDWEGSVVGMTERLVFVDRTAAGEYSVFLFNKFNLTSEAHISNPKTTDHLHGPTSRQLVIRSFFTHPSFDKSPKPCPPKPSPIPLPQPFPMPYSNAPTSAPTVHAPILHPQVVPLRALPHPVPHGSQPSHAPTPNPIPHSTPHPIPHSSPHPTSHPAPHPQSQGTHSPAPPTALPMPTAAHGHGPVPAAPTGGHATPAPSSHVPSPPHPLGHGTPLAHGAPVAGHGPLAPGVPIAPHPHAPNATHSPQSTHAPHGDSHGEDGHGADGHGSPLPPGSCEVSLMGCMNTTFPEFVAKNHTDAVTELEAGDQEDKYCSDFSQCLSSSLTGRCWSSVCGGTAGGGSWESQPKPERDAIADLLKRLLESGSKGNCTKRACPPPRETRSLAPHPKSSPAEPPKEDDGSGGTIMLFGMIVAGIAVAIIIPLCVVHRIRTANQRSLASPHGSPRNHPWQATTHSEMGRESTQMHSPQQLRETERNAHRVAPPAGYSPPPRSRGRRGSRGGGYPEEDSLEYWSEDSSEEEGRYGSSWGRRGGSHRMPDPYTDSHYSMDPYSGSGPMEPSYRDYSYGGGSAHQGYEGYGYPAEDYY